MLVIGEGQEGHDHEREQRHPDLRVDAGDHAHGLAHARQVGPDVDGVGDDEQRTRAPQHPARVAPPHHAGEATAADHAEPRAHELDRRHEGEGEERRP